MSATILIIDADPVQLRLLETMVHQFGYQAETAASTEAMLARLQALSAAQVDLAILDLAMPNGMAVLARLRERGAKLPIIVRTARGSVESVVPLMRLGAQDFVVNPVAPERLQVAIKNALATARLAEEVRFLSRRARGTLAFQDLAGASAEMARAIRQGEKAANWPFPCFSKGSPVPARKFSRARSTALQAGAAAPSRPSIAAPRQTISRACCLGAKRGRVPPKRPSANASRRGAARFFSTGSANCRWKRRRGFCASSKRARSIAPGRNAHRAPMSA